jgi:beta-lactamase regulating signal transducer with metallopeptidase domain
MNAIEMLLAKPIFQALGWALVHFIWQGAVVAALYAMTSIFLRRCAANVRYGVACAALVVMVALPLATMFVMSMESVRSSDDRAGSKPITRATQTISRPDAELTAQAEASAQITAASTGASEPLLSTRPVSIKEWASERFNSFLPWLVAAWFAGVLLLSIRFLGGLIVAERLKHREANPLLEQWQEKLSTLARQLRVSRPVRLCESVLVEVPTVIGWMRPVILVPASALTGLSGEQLEALLAHELAHIRRYDYLINLLQTAVETLLFYHPAVWWVSGQIRQEREHCCDDLAVATCGSVLVYARALAELEQLRSVAPQLAVAANGGSLLYRIQRLVGSPAQRSRRFESGLAGVIALATIFSMLAGAQTAILSQSTPADDAQDARAFESSAAPARDKLTLNQLSNLKPLRKSQDDLLQGELDKSADTAAYDQPVQDGEEKPSVDDREQEQKPNGSQDFIAAIKALGYTDLSVDDLTALEAQAVTPDFIREMNSLMNQKLSVDHLTAFRVHGVTPEFINELRSLGFANLSADQLAAFRIHGVTPDFISAWKSAGYTDLSADSLTALRIHGVTLALVQQMKDLGFDRLSSDQLTALRIHGVTPNFIQAMRTFIRGDISIDDFMGLRIHGVSPEFIKELDILGYSNLSADQLMGMRIHGVTPNFIQAVQALGYKPTVDDLTSMRIHGVTPDFIETVKSRGFNDVTVTQIIELRRLNIVPGSRKK